MITSLFPFTGSKIASNAHSPAYPTLHRQREIRDTAIQNPPKIDNVTSHCAAR